MKKMLLSVAATAAVTASAAFHANVVAPAKIDGRNSDTAPSVGINFTGGFLGGTSGEYVYDHTDAGARQKMSELDWDLSALTILGCNGTLKLGPFSLNGGLWVAGDEGTDGEMDDYDWYDGSSIWTDYSRSEADVINGVMLDVNTAIDFPVFSGADSGFIFRGMLGFKYDNWEFEAHGGYGLYDELGYSPYYFGRDNLIRYEQKFYMPYIGAGADMILGEIIQLSAYLKYSPLVYADDWDEHYERNVSFHEEFEEGEMFAGGVEAKLILSENIFLAASVDFQIIDEIIGDMDYRDNSTGEYEKYKDGAGIDNEYAAFSLSFGLAF